MRRAFAFLCFIALTACGTELQQDEGTMFRMSDDSGSLLVQLRGSDAEGRAYRLRNATFDVSGTAMVTLSDQAPGGTSRDALSTPLPTGSYQVYLRPGYRLVELSADGSERVVAASLRSPHPLRVRVGVRSDHQVALRFHNASAEIVFGTSQAPLAEKHTPGPVLARIP
jgi:hypothetical protein